MPSSRTMEILATWGRELLGVFRIRLDYAIRIDLLGTQIVFQVKISLVAIGPSPFAEKYPARADRRNGMPRRVALSSYAGPIPRPVVPILPSPFFFFPSIVDLLVVGHDDLRPFADHQIFWGTRQCPFHSGSRSLREGSRGPPPCRCRQSRSFPAESPTAPGG